MTRGIRLALLLLIAAHAAVAGDALRVRSEVVDRDGSVARADETLAPNRFIVELEPPRAAASTQREARATRLARFRDDLRSVASGGAVTIRREYSTLFFGAAVEGPPRAIAAIRALGYVRAIHPDRQVRAYQTAEPIDARPRVNAQALAARGTGVVVAIIDTGIDYRHPALGGGFGPAFKVMGGYDFVNDDADPMDDHGHGTHVAGIAAANSPELVGVAPDARLLGYKVLSQNGFGSSSDIIAALERSVDPNGDGDRADAADVVNLSLGSGGTADDPLARAADAAVAAGVIVVVAAGNEGETASIGSPGAAARVITVGAIDGIGVLANFSSRGPTSKLLTFKPDVMAPGVMILSARVGGGVLAASGTSMASPHVAGVAALIHEAHPEWSPEKVKAAIVGGAGSMLGTPFARGAGKIDAARAVSGAILLSESGVSFGLAPASSGNATVTRQVTITNATAAAETFTSTGSSSPGMIVSVQPDRLELGAGQSATVTLELKIDNAIASFPDEPMMGGDVRFSNLQGTRSFSIPWGILRSARATVTYDGLTTGVLGFTPSATKRPIQYGAGDFEMFVKPGSAWEFVLTGLDFDDEGTSTMPIALRYLVAEKHLVDGDTAVPFTAAGASVRIPLAATDHAGTPLRDLPEEGEAQRRFAAARLLFGDGDWRLGSMVQVRGLRDVYVSPVSARYTLIPFETYIDTIAMRGYNVQHPVVVAPAASSTIDAPAAAYRHARLRWIRPQLAPELFVACSAGAETRGSAFSFGASGCAGLDIDGPVTFDYYSTPETTGDAFAGLVFQTGSSTTATFRGVENGIVASSEASLPRTAAVIPDGGEASIGGGVFFPFAYYGTTAGLAVFFPQAGFFGPFGETLRDDTVPVYWQGFNAEGAQISGGRVDPRRGIVPLAATNGSRLVVRREWRHQSGLTSAGTLEVTFAASGTDLQAPTVTSMRIETPTAVGASRIPTGGAATLHFSAGDLDHGKRMEPKPTKVEATRASWRRAGAADWIPLAVTAVDSETGSTNTLRHVPAGDIYRADLTPATAAAGVVDLRIELEDLVGNRVIWTQEGALFVGAESAAAPKARRVKRP